LGYAQGAALRGAQTGRKATVRRVSLTPDIRTSRAESLSDAARHMSRNPRVSAIYWSRRCATGRRDDHDSSADDRVPMLVDLYGSLSNYPEAVAWSPEAVRKWRGGMR
jgi:hypothetical protein